MHLHFVGIGGSGMSGLARLCAARGDRVTGSDRRPDRGPAATLCADGFSVTADDTPLPPGVEQVVVTAAIPEDHPQRLAAEAAGLPVIKYAAMLGRLMAEPGREGVAVAGTHGKSTTTVLLCHALATAGLDPSAIVGAASPLLARGGSGSGSGAGSARAVGFRVGAGRLLLAEACEFDRSFHRLSPRHLVVLNLEADHLDCYGNEARLAEAFAHLSGLLPADGTLLVNADNIHTPAMVEAAGCAASGVATYAAGSAARRDAVDWYLHVSPGCWRLRGPGVEVAWTPPNGPGWSGLHMAWNAAAAAATALRLGASTHAVSAAMATARPPVRRLDPRGTHRGVQIVDDYAHHPTELKATLLALRAGLTPNGRLGCVFQPHQHARTRLLMDGFAESFGHADVVWVCDIYAARDTAADTAAVSSAELVRRLRKRGVSAHHTPTLEDAAAAASRALHAGDTLAALGAGDVDAVIPLFRSHPGQTTPPGGSAGDAKP